MTVDIKLTVSINSAALSDCASSLNIEPAALLKIIEAVISGPERRKYAIAYDAAPDVESDIRLAVLGGEVGFRSGWISSLFTDKLIADRVPRLRRRAVMRHLGYVPHPALHGGRVNNPVEPDGGRPVLYLREGHPALGLTAPPEIAAAYSAAQLGEPAAAAEANRAHSGA